MESVPFGVKTPPRSRSNSQTSQRTKDGSDAENFSLRVRLERTLTDNADLHQQVIFKHSMHCLFNASIQSYPTYYASESNVATMLYMQVEVGKRERLLASAELAGLKKYHFKEVHELQDQLLTQRAAVSKLTKQLQEAMQVVCAYATAQSLLLMWVNTQMLLSTSLTLTSGVQDNHQAIDLQDEISTMRQSHGISIKHLQVIRWPQLMQASVACKLCC